MLSVVVLNVIMLSVIMTNVIMISVATNALAYFPEGKQQRIKSFMSLTPRRWWNILGDPDQKQK
jgi:hypothetical protein